MKTHASSATCVGALVAAVLLLTVACTPRGGSEPADPGNASATVESPSGSAPTSVQIDTTTGTLRGEVRGGAARLLGVRYAEPPTGERRWTPPVPAPDTDQVLDATRPGPACPQDGATALGVGSSEEDCLFLNVTMPAQMSDRPRPLMVWWHGGGFTSGGGSQYDAQRLAVNGDVVVVTANYRLGMLGYLGLPGLEGSGNFGLADQLAALTWAKDNAAALGADPDDVTLFGESAGGTSTCAALTSPAAQGLVDRAIIASGSCRLAWPKGTLFPGLPASRSLIPLDQSEALGLTAAKAVGCTDADPLPCLRSAPLPDLIKQAALFGNPLAYGTKLLSRDPEVAVQRGDVAKVPVLVGGNRDEHRSFIGGLLLTDPNAVTAEKYPQLVKTSFGAAAPAVLRTYPLADDASAALVWSTLVTDVAWACTTTAGSRELAAAGATVYGYEFADRTAPDVSGVASSGLPQGAAHATDLPYYFDLGGQDLLEGAGQHELADTMVTLFTTFARTGKLTAPVVKTWPPTTAQTAPVLQLTDTGTELTDHRAEHNCAFWEAVEPQLKSRPER